MGCKVNPRELTGVIKLSGSGGRGRLCRGSRRGGQMSGGQFLQNIGQLQWCFNRL